MLSNSFKWKHYEGETILLNVRWYLKYPVGYRNLKEMMAERGIKVDHTTLMRRVHQCSPEIEKKTLFQNLVIFAFYVITGFWY